MKLTTPRSLVGKRVKLKHRTMCGWKGVAVVIDVRGKLFYLIKEDDTSWVGDFIAVREDFSICGEQHSLVASAVCRLAEESTSIREAIFDAGGLFEAIDTHRMACG